MTERGQSSEDRLARLASATESLAPSPGFNARVLRSVNEVALPSWQTAVFRLGRAALVVAAVAAVAAVGIAMESEQSKNEALATSYGLVELSW